MMAGSCLGISPRSTEVVARESHLGARMLLLRMEIDASAGVAYADAAMGVASELQSLAALWAWGPVSPPRWAVGLLGATRSIREPTSGVGVQRTKDGSFCLATVRVANAASLSASDFQDATTEAYQRLHAAFEEGDARHLVRVWNFIPGILEPLDELPQRYMAFNAGRFAAYSGWYAGEQDFKSRVATASGVGHDGCDLVIHALAARHRGEPVENPRQVPSYRYSSRYGPRPPCFSRATRVTVATGQPPWLLVGGTASVSGEETRNEGDLEAQLDETLRNLEALVDSGLSKAAGVTDARGALGCFRHLRVYHVRPGDEGWVHRSVERHFPALEDFAVYRADLCRPGLLVEIEGVAVP